MKIQIIRSSRRSISLEVASDLTVTVRAPSRYSDEKITQFAERHSDWIAAHIEKQKRRNSRLSFPLDTDPDLLRKAAKQVLPPLVERYAKLTGLEPTGIKITSAKKRLGSCTPDNSLNFSYRLMCYPPEVIEYVVLHEIAHIKEHNHSKRFYALIAKYMPDWKERVKIIKG